MANHGGRTAPLARTHRPRAPIMSVPAPVTAPLAPLRPTVAPVHVPAPSSVTLSSPRPDSERRTNEYVETPFRGGVVPVPFAVSGASEAREKAAPPPVPRPARLPLSGVHVAITKQPVAFTKEQPSCGASSGGGAGNIMCERCGRCRCEPCKRPRALPERWVCDNACLCSADAVIDYASCLCCVKGLYYHCSETDAGATCADEPCSCAPGRRLARWGCLSALAAVLPCLLCYWPLRACQRAVEAAYARHSRSGCRCPTPTHHNAATPEKRLLDSSPEY